MTGQVKEEILTRFGELGVRVKDGTLSFHPVLLRPRDFRRDPGTYRFFDLDGIARSINIPAGALVFTYCQVPVVYELNNGDAWIRVTTGDGVSSTEPGSRLDAKTSEIVFARRGEIVRIDVGVPEHSLVNLD
jgi:hypothetical protein